MDRRINNFNKTEQTELAQSLIPQLTPEQQEYFDAATNYALQGSGGLVHDGCTCRNKKLSPNAPS